MSRTLNRESIFMKHTLVAVLLVAAGLLSACGVPPSVPQDRYYRIDVASPDADSAVLNGVVEMDRFGAEGLSSGRAIVFVAEGEGLALQEYNYDFWIEPPSVMLRDALIGYLRAANVAQIFVTPEMRANAPYLMTGRIHRLETLRDNSPAAVVELELALTDTRTGTIKLVRSYMVEVPAEDGTVKAAVAAANTAVSDIFARFLSDLRAL